MSTVNFKSIKLSKKNIIYYFITSLLFFIIFGIHFETNTNIESIQHFMLDKISSFFVILLISITVFGLVYKKIDDNKSIEKLLSDIISLIIGIFIGVIFYYLIYSIYYVISNSYINYAYKRQISNILKTSLIYIGYFILLELFELLNNRIIKGYKISDIFYIILSLAMMFLFIFTNNSNVFVLFYGLISAFGSFLLYYTLLFISRIQAKSKSSFILINNMIEKRMIFYYSISILVLFITITGIFNEYNKYKYNKSFYLYDSETSETSDDLKKYLADSPKFRYNVLESKYDFEFLNNYFIAYSIDLSSASSFFNIKYTEKLSTIPTNAIILPELSRRVFKSDIGDKLIIQIDNEFYEYIVYGYYESGNNLIVFTNVSIDNNNEKLLIDVDNKELLDELRDKFDIVTRDSFIIEKPFLNSALVSFIISIISSIIPIFTIIILYFKMKKSYLNKISDVPKKLINAGVKRKEIKRLIFNSELTQYLVSLIFVGIYTLLIFVIYHEKLSELLAIYKNPDFFDYLTYFFMIFIFYNIILMFEYLLGRVSYEKEKD